MSVQPKPRLPRKAKADVEADLYDERCYWIPLGWAALLVDRPKITIVKWVDRGQLQSKVEAGQRVVWLGEVWALSDASPRRKRARVAPL